MNSFIKSLPRTVFAILILGVGILLIIMFDPPHTLCRSQVDDFKEKQKVFLFEGEKKILGKQTAPEIEKYLDLCIQRNGPGGCAEYFYRLKEMLRDLDNVSSQCKAYVGEVSNVKNAFWQSVEVLVRAAWGANPPKSSSQRAGWLSTSEIGLYCQLKSQCLKMYGKSPWEAFREKMLTALPGSEKMTREKVWSLNLLSTNCDKY